jgi:hypothetical protein
VNGGEKVNSVSEVKQTGEIQETRKKEGSEAISGAFEALLAAMMNQPLNIPLSTAEGQAGLPQGTAQDAELAVGVAPAQEVMDLAGKSLNQVIKQQSAGEEAAFELNISGEIPEAAVTDDSGLKADMAAHIPQAGKEKALQAPTADKKAENADKTAAKKEAITVKQEEKPEVQTGENDEPKVKAKENENLSGHTEPDNREAGKDTEAKKIDRLKKFSISENRLGSSRKANAGEFTGEDTKPAGLDENRFCKCF